MAKQKQKGMTETELAALCGQEYQDAKRIDQIIAEREAALKSYSSDPYGGEVDGLAKFVTSDVRDVIEWTLPQLIDIFVMSDAPVVFEPDDEKDVEQADHETKYCQHVFERQNNGFLQTYIWFKDALISKNGIMKCWWDERECKEKEEYRNKDLADYNQLATDPEFEITQMTVRLPNGQELSQTEYAELIASFTDAPSASEIIEAATYDIIGYRKNDQSQIRIEALAPERFFVNRNHNSPDPGTARYACEIQTETRSSLKEQGYNPAMVDNLTASTDDLTLFGSENVLRYQKEGGPSDDSLSLDRNREELVIYNHYIEVDYDGDGRTELRYVRTNGAGGEVLSNEVVDRNIFHALTPYINTHKFYGRSIADNMMDIQKAKTQMTRALLDNLSYSVIPRKIVSGNVNTDDLFSMIVGGIIRKDPDATIDNDTIPFVAGDAMPMVDFFNALRAERSGFSKDTMGLNPDALSNSTNLVGTMILNQSQLLVKMIASIFANTGFNSLMLHIRELANKHEKKQRIFEAAGEYLTADPREWRKQRNTQVKTGIGYAAKAEKISVLSQFLGMYEKMTAAGGLETPLTSADGLYRLIKDIGDVSGVKTAGKYFRDPATYEPPPPVPTAADRLVQLNEEKEANQAERDEAKLMQDTNQFKQKMAFEREKWLEEQEWDREKFEREMIYKYGDAARRGFSEFVNAEQGKERSNGKKDDDQSGTGQTSQPAAG